MSCDTDEITPSKDFGGLEYFPLNLNEVNYFKNTEINFTIFGSDTTTYFTKEEVFSLIDSNNTKTAYIKISKSNTETGTYSPSQITSFAIKGNHIITNIENVNYLRAITPLEKDKVFNQNLYNQSEEKLARIQQIGGEITTTNYLGSFTFKDVLNIIFEEKSNNIDNIKKHQIYVKNKGLVYDLNQEINQQPNQLAIGYKKIKIRL
jgi:hypothetical protein